MIRAPTLALLFLAAAQAGASGFSQKDAGTAAGQFLRLGADARSEGMGEAVHAAAEDASAVYWNPAGLAGLSYRHAALTHGVYYQSVFYDFLSYAQPVQPILAGRRERELRANDQYGAFGVSLLYLNAGQISELDNTGQPTGQSFTPQDAAVMAAWGIPLSRWLDIGVGGKYISSRLKDSASTGAFDLGARLHFYLFELPYTFSAGVQNLGGRLQYIKQGDPLPLTISVGNCLKITRDFIIGADVVAARDGAPYPSFGGEYRLAYDSQLSAALRLGYQRRTSGSELEGFTGMTAGGGVTFSRLGFDYAWAPFGVLGDTHRITVSYRF